MRSSGFGAFALDYGAVVAFAQLGGPMDETTRLLLSEALPLVEGQIIKGLRREDEE
ncbi:hypothetical protein [Brevundimonas naejangsanensis]|uniref:hypothetical protein n=1 Tax=Brevundimonas naejangsanensis TaxID=588932 RepID=UPI0026F2FFC7|nr:hypothetical protein [Brevundimonas naejangsanensis]